jgi:hypothetical protein
VECNDRAPGGTSPPQRRCWADDQGLNTQIAGRLTSASTIKSHVSSILSKLGVASRTEAVSLALRNQIVN